jgi:cell division protein ZapE
VSGHATGRPSGVSARYHAALAARGFAADAAQLAAVARLDRLHDELVAFRNARDGTIKRLINRPSVPRGVWMWGGVGRGKSFLMDCFAEAVPIRRKGRLHFHEFMRGVHRELDELKGKANPLTEVAERIAHRYRLLCFDEFHISDIADAMILERLLAPMFELGVVLVATSNYAPSHLYPNGLHRDRILPAIALLEQYLDVVNVDAGTDYRRLALASLRVYLHPLGRETDAALAEAFARLAERSDESPELRIENRNVRALRRAGGVVWFDFETLCGGPRSQNDYLELARQFHTVVLSGVPQLGSARASEARRFTWLVDVLYDQHVKLIVGAQTPPEQLYVEGAMAIEFQRTVSRLVEMQSAAYLGQSRRGVAERLV